MLGQQFLEYGGGSLAEVEAEGASLTEAVRNFRDGALGDAPETIFALLAGLQALAPLNALVPGAAMQAYADLQQQPNCAAMFGGLPYGVGPWSILTEVSISTGPLLGAYASTSLTGGNITFSDGSAIAAAPSIPGAPAPPVFGPSPNIASKGVIGAAQTTIHEMVHAAVALYPGVSGPSGWVQVDNSGQDSFNNRDIVSGACGPPRN